MIQSFDYKHCKIAYSVVGRGRTLVFLHGFLERSNMWDGIAAALKNRFRILCIDLFGHGGSENFGYIHTMEEQADMVKAVTSSLGLRRFVLIGHSMGGYVGLAFAKKYSKNLRGFVLMNSTALADSPEKFNNRNRAIKAVKQNHELFLQIAIPMLFSEKNRDSCSETIKILIEEAKSMSPQGIVASLEGMKIRKERTSVYQLESLPMAMVIGKQDPVLDHQALKTQIENTHVQSIELSEGHMSHLENSEEIIHFLKKFINSL